MTRENKRIWHYTGVLKGLIFKWQANSCKSCLQRNLHFSAVVSAVIYIPHFFLLFLISNLKHFPTSHSYALLRISNKKEKFCIYKLLLSSNLTWDIHLQKHNRLRCMIQYICIPKLFHNAATSSST